MSSRRFIAPTLASLVLAIQGCAERGPVEAPIIATPNLPVVAAGASSGSNPPIDFCAAMTEHAQRCEDPKGADDCPREKQCAVAILRPEAYAVLSDCLRDHPCGEPPKACLMAVGAKLTPTARFAAFERECTSRRDACGADSFEDDYCSAAISAFRGEVLGSLESCLQRPCDDVRSCLKQAIRSAGCP